MNRTRTRIGVLATTAMLLGLGGAAALASDVHIAVVDVTVPADAVTIVAGSSGSITTNIRVTGKQEGTATFKVFKDWTLSGGTFTGLPADVHRRSA